MNCPRCTSEDLEERERSGITVDVCVNCRGLWLDRGELEKLIARATIDFEEVAERRDSRLQSAERRDSTPPRGIHADRGRDDDARHPRKKRRWFDALGDIFD